MLKISNTKTHPYTVIIPTVLLWFWIGSQPI